MKFDFAIGNPPYQDETIGDNDNYSPQVYNIFLEESYKIADKVELIHPARFLFNAGSTPKAWNEKMLNDEHLKILKYESDAKKIFANVSIPGGIAISYHDNNKKFEPIEVFSSFSEVNTIRTKVMNKNDKGYLPQIIESAYSYHFDPILYSQHPELKGCLSKGHDYDLKSNVFEKLSPIFFDDTDGSDMILIFGRENNKRTQKYIKREYIQAPGNLDKYKVFISGADGAAGTIGNPLPARICGSPSVGNKGVGHTESFISIGSFDTENEANNMMKYLKTKIFRLLLGILKATQAVTPDKFKYVPLQDFSASSDIDWAQSISELDKQLYKKYNLSKEEIDFIESHVKEMD